MAEQNESKSLEERMTSCPIHKWADIDDYLRRAQVPQKFNKPFHELVLARGESPKNMSDGQGKEFGSKAVEIIKRYEIQPIEAQSIGIMFGQLTEQWIASGATNN